MLDNRWPALENRWSVLEKRSIWAFRWLTNGAVFSLIRAHHVAVDGFAVRLSTNGSSVCQKRFRITDRLCKCAPRLKILNFPVCWLRCRATDRAVC